MIEIKEFGKFEVNNGDSKKAILHTFFQCSHEGDDILIYFQEQEDGTIVLSDKGRTIKNSVFERGEDMNELVSEICEANLVELDENDCLIKTIENASESEEFYFMEIAGFIQTCILISNLV